MYAGPFEDPRASTGSAQLGEHEVKEAMMNLQIL